jgi:ubiquinone biosynthesis UbiH/UbiF/VisC/COQ6 family hydroxylase
MLRNVHFFRKSISKFCFSTSNYQVIETEVTIVGGGVTGFSLASALCKSSYFQENNKNKKIIIIDNQPQTLNDSHFKYSADRIPDLRVVTLTPSSVRFLKSINHWNMLDKKLIKDIKHMQIYESIGSSYMHIDNSDIKSLAVLNSFFPSINDMIHENNLCYTVEINNLLNGFVHLNELNKEFIDFYKLNLSKDEISIENNEGYVNLFLHKEQKVIRSKLLVASDGVKSTIRNKLNLPTYGFDYNETGLVCTFRGNKSSVIAYQRFMHNGIFALLPLYDNLYSIVCSMPVNINENISKLSDEEFLAFVNRLLNDPSQIDFSHLDRLIFSNKFSHPPIMNEIVSKRVQFPLTLQYAKNSVSDNVVLIGDASHVIHPMAGQGLNLGLSDSAVLADILIRGLNLGRSLNDKRNMDEFESFSYKNTKSMIFALELIKNSFASKNLLLSAVRNVGMSILNNTSMFKSACSMFASGNVLMRNDKFSWEL